MKRDGAPNGNDELFPEPIAQVIGALRAFGTGIVDAVGMAVSSNPNGKWPDAWPIRDDRT
jgi:hypothetical protein